MLIVMMVGECATVNPSSRSDGCSRSSGKSEVRELHFQRWPLNFHVGLQPRGQGPSDADASEYSMPYLPFFSVLTYVPFLCI